MNRLALLLVSLAPISSIYCKRHSRANKIERYERRAQAAAEKNSPLASALSKQTKKMSFDEAVLAQEYYRKAKEIEMIIKCGERILAVGGDQEVLRATRLELAELFLERQQYKNAEKHAQDYLMYYPGSDESKKASFIALDATYRSQSDSYRDQKKTRATIDMADDFLKKYPTSKEHNKAVQDMLDKSYLKLIRSEMNIIDTQVHRFNRSQSKSSLAAAQKRLEYLKENYLPHAQGAQKRILELEITLAKADNNTELLEKKKAELGLYTAHKPTIKLAQANSTVPQKVMDSVKELIFEDNEKFFA